MFFGTLLALPGSRHGRQIRAACRRPQEQAQPLPAGAPPLAGKLLLVSGAGAAAVEPTRKRHGKEPFMLWTIVLILIILWALGFAVHIGGGLIHLLLVIALIVAIVRLIQGRPVL
jgi:Family of unknown function (DUF5670)